MKTILKSIFDTFQQQAKNLRMRSKFLRNEEGNALIEMALAISLLGVPMLVGTVEIGSMIYTSIEVSNAAHTGAMYGMISSTFAANSSGIVTAAQGEATDLGTNLSVTPTVYYACSNSIGGTQYSTQSSANTACTNGSNHSLQFVQVNTTATVTMPIRCPGLPSTFTLNGSSVIEVQE
jgi:Flp pilus assembly protein TadG